MSEKTMDFLQELGLKAINPGTCTGVNEWSTDDSAGLIESHNPATGELLGKVVSASAADYEKVLSTAVKVAKQWRTVPGPQRGEAVRLVGEALRKHKDALGSLVAAEMGKIKSEGDGEVQEMIDMADFAVGQSRMMYGNTMHSERPGHRMYDQWHPLGVVGIISAFNFPVAVWSWNAFVAAICGNVSIWKPSQKVPLCSIAVQVFHQSSCCSMTTAMSWPRNLLMTSVLIWFLSQVLPTLVDKWVFKWPNAWDVHC